VNFQQKNVTMFHAAAGVIAVAALIGLGRSILAPTTIASCTTRYPNATSFNLERNGTPLTAEDLLARLGSAGVGVLGNVEVMRPRDSRIPAAMKISLRPGHGAAADANAGVSFPWHPRSLQNQRAACLSYYVFLFSEFDFQNGGVLPGIEGHAPQGTDRFTAQIAWRQGGQLAANVMTREKGEPTIVRYDAPGYTIPRGQWTKVDQEIVLNTPGKDDGALRVWLDNWLAIEKKDVSYREKSEVGLSGVAANIFYGAPDAPIAPSADAKVHLSPFEVSWN